MRSQKSSAKTTNTIAVIMAGNIQKFCHCPIVVASSSAGKLSGKLRVNICPNLSKKLTSVVSAIESQSVGTPVVVSATGGLTEVVNDEMSGLIAPMGDPNAIARAIIRISQNVNLQRRLSFRGQEMVAESFTPEILVP